MKRGKWLLWSGAGLLVILLLGVVWGIWRIRSAWPQVRGSVTVPGVSAPVDIIRNEWGVPHIYAANEHDLLFAQGYVHAQDRLWQMEMNRRLSSGSLSEVLGESSLGIDRYTRTLGLYRMAVQSWREIDQESQAMLEAYAEGVNAYMATHQGQLALEFTLVGAEPEPWTPVDSLALGNMMALNMGVNAHSELLEARFVAKFGPEGTAQLFPIVGENTPIIVPDEVSDYQRLHWNEKGALTAVPFWQDDGYTSWGSNNWVVHGSRTATGQPLLANDTHLDLTIPSIWYENGVHGGRFDSVGFTLPGVPLVVLGRNAHIAWGLTNLDPDVQDIYLEKLDDKDNPSQYQFKGEWRDLEIIPETILVKGHEPVELTIYRTQHGPLINDVYHLASEEPMALRWTLYEGSQLFTAIRALNLASNWDEFRAALQDWDIISQNFVYADDQGNIGYQAAGKIPIRVAGHQGIVPVPGWNGEYEWQGFIPAAELPTLFNPPAGFIATANNRAVSSNYPYLIAYDWYNPGYRAQRITELLAGGHDFTMDDMQAIQSQSYSPPAAVLRPYLLAIEPQNERQARALDYVAAWDLQYEPDAVGATIFETWYLSMLDSTVYDEMGTELHGEYAALPTKHVPMLIELMKDPTNPWFDDVSTPAVETRDEIIRRSLENALNWLEDQYRRDFDDLPWGKVHMASFTHVPFGSSGIPPLENLFNSNQVPVSGSRFTVNVTWYSDPFAAEFGTAQRMIIDMANATNGLAINSTGQSEHLFHANREDQITMWRDFAYHAMPLSLAEVKDNTDPVLTLKPQ